MNNFKKIYVTIQTIKRQYELGAITKEQAQQTISNTYDSIKNIYPKNTPEYGTACGIYRNYSQSLKDGNKNLNFDDCIFENQVENICKLLKENEITQFTFSSSYSGFTELAYEFQKCGYYVVGMTEINSQYRDLDTNECEKRPAFIFKLKRRIK